MKETTHRELFESRTTLTDQLLYNMECYGTGFLLAKQSKNRNKKKWKMNGWIDDDGGKEVNLSLIFFFFFWLQEVVSERC